MYVADAEVDGLTSSIANQSDSLESLFLNLDLESRFTEPGVDIPLRCRKLSQLVTSGTATDSLTKQYWVSHF